VKATTTGRRWLLAAVLLPIAGVAGLVARSEVALRGHEWRFPISGYDPRDLLRGHYLTYRIEWDPAPRPDGRPCRECCLCLERGATRRVSRIECAGPARCDVLLAPDEERELSRFYVPEDEAQELERAVRAARGEIVLVERRGRLSIKELLIDGRPWQLHRPAAIEP
jgi:hypothetical protein